MIKLKAFLKGLNKTQLLVLIILLCVSGIAHGYNMFGFPYFENDEGTYMSQAWSLLYQNKLAPYTYWYDHAPFGWILLAAWIKLTGGFYTFGFSLNSGRVFMLILHLFSTYLVFAIGTKLSKNTWVGIIATLIFSLTPLGLYFHRRILLDNMMTFLMLLSYYLVIFQNKKLIYYLISAVLFGLAVLTKENAAFYLPAFMYTIYVHANVQHRTMLLAKWFLIVCFIGLFYLLYALLNGELFPYGSQLGGQTPHVSLLGTLAYQASRGSKVAPNETSSFAHMFSLWVQQDVLLIYIGLIATAFLGLLSLILKRYLYFSVFLLHLFCWLFLLRGGLVLEFYIVPALPLLALGIALTFDLIFTPLKGKTGKYIMHTLYSVLTIVLLSIYGATNSISRAFGVNNSGHNFFSAKQTQGQMEAIDWIRKNVDTESVMLIDDFSHLEFLDPKNPSGLYFPNAIWYWKAGLDPQVQRDVLKNSNESIDFMARTPQMEHDVSMGGLDLVSKAFANASYVTDFQEAGWGVEIWTTRYPNQVLTRSWESYKKNYIVNNSYVVDPANNRITSEGQSYALLRAVWLDDKETFDEVWRWTQNNLINSDGTIAWNTTVNEHGVIKINDHGSAADGDTDTALSLIFASKKWDQPSYLTDAQRLLDAVWESEVKELNGKYFLVPGPWAKGKEEVIINPSYLSPYAYRIFAQVDKDHPWESLVDTSYEVLEGCTTASYGDGNSSVGLPPNWCALTTSGDFIQSPEEGLSSTEYSYDAVRTMWRLALDYKWYKEDRALKYLNRSKSFFENKLKTEGKILTGYTHDGKTFDNYESALGNSFVLANYTVTDIKKAASFYKERILIKFYEDFDKKLSYWEVPDNYYTQNWAWFNTALYAEKLPNLWETSSKESK